MYGTNFNIAEFRRNYERELEELTFNSKPIINSLTQIADEGRQAAAEVVALIHQHLEKAPVEQQLPCLYLIDSIVKNIGEPYRHMFDGIIAGMFLRSFRRCPVNIQEDMRRLFKTWDGVFGPQTLVDIDQGVRDFYGSHPQAAPLAQSGKAIHVNPKFMGRLSNDEAMQAGRDAHGGFDVQAVLARSRATPEGVAWEHQREPFAHQRQYDDTWRYESERGYRGKRPQPNRDFPQRSPPRYDTYRIEYENRGYPEPYDQYRGHYRGAAHEEGYYRNPPEFHYSGHPPQDTGGERRRSPPTHHNDPNVSGLLSNPDALMKLAKELNTITQATSAQPVDASRSVGAVMTKQASRNVKQQPPSSCDPVMDAVERFYSALPHQCKTCGFRFLSSSEHSKHLDWHFRINRMQNQKGKTPVSRSWYLTADDWTTFEGTEVIDKPAVPFFGTENGEETTEIAQAEPEDIPRARADEKKSSCYGCGEAFTQEWDEKEEEWVFINAQSTPDDAHYCHPRCFDGGTSEPGRSLSASADLVSEANGDSMKHSRGSENDYANDHGAKKPRLSDEAEALVQV